MELNLTDQALRKLLMLLDRTQSDGGPPFFSAHNGELDEESITETKSGKGDAGQDDAGEANLDRPKDRNDEIKENPAKELEKPQEKEDSDNTSEMDGLTQKPKEIIKTESVGLNQTPSFVSISRHLESKRAQNSKSSSKSSTSILNEDPDVTKLKGYLTYIETSDLVPKTEIIESPPAPQPSRPRPSRVDPRTVRIFLNHAELHKGHSPTNEEDLPEGIARPAYVPAVIRRTEEKIVLTDFYRKKNESQNSPTQGSLMGLLFRSGALSPVEPIAREARDMRRSLTELSINSTSSLGKFLKREKEIKIRRDHWKPDRLATRCKGCGREFSLIFRKHHCRKCGDIFCDQCLENTVKLDANLNFKLFDFSVGDAFLAQHEQFAGEVGHEVKSCENCHREYKRYVENKIKALKWEGDIAKGVEKRVEAEEYDTSDDKNDEEMGSEEEDGYDWSSF